MAGLHGSRHGISTIADLIRARAVEHPDRTALICEGRQTTFSTLNRRASQVANGFAAFTGRHRTAAVLDANSDLFFELLCGAAKAGWILLPLNWRLTESDLVFMLNDAQADVLFVGADFSASVTAIRNRCPMLEEVVVLRELGDRFDAYGSWRDRQSPIDPATPVTESMSLLHLYTSGTTGVAKGVRLTHRHALLVAPVLSREFGSAANEELTLACLPLFHVGGIMWVLSCLYASLSCVILRQVDAAELVSSVSRYRVSKIFLVPTLLHLLLQAAERRASDLSSLQLVVYGGSPISKGLLRRALTTLACEFAQVYGLTETGGAITYLRPADHDLPHGQRLLSCGQPLPGVELRIVDDRGHDLPEGEVGEILCRTPQNMTGYWNREAESLAAFHGDWLRTGDAGFLDADGYLYLQDRLKDAIITGGENVYPAEVERVLATHPAIAEVAVIGVPDDRWGERVAALVVTKEDREATAADIIGFCKPLLAGYKVPTAVVFVQSLPRNLAGKLLKEEMRAPYWMGHTRRIN